MFISLLSACGLLGLGFRQSTYVYKYGFRSPREDTRFRELKKKSASGIGWGKLFLVCLWLLLVVLGCFTALEVKVESRNMWLLEFRSPCLHDCCNRD